LTTAASAATRSSVQGGVDGFKENELTTARNAMSNLVGIRKTGADGGCNWFLMQESTTSPAPQATP
jgi:hypothetical protein